MKIIAFLEYLSYQAILVFSNDLSVDFQMITAIDSKFSSPRNNQ